MESGGTHTELHTYTLTHRHTHTDTHAQKGRNARGCSSSQLLFPLIFWYLFTFFPRSFHFFLDSLKASDVSYGFYRIVLTFFCHYSWFWGAVSMLFEAILRDFGLIFGIFWDLTSFLNAFHSSFYGCFGIFVLLFQVSSGILQDSRFIFEILFVFSRDFWWDFWRLMTHFWRFIGLFGPQQLFCGFSLRMSSTQFAFVISHLELFQVS